MVPEEPFVATVRNDVIDHVGEAAAAARAMVMLRHGEERFAFTLPLAVITALAGRRPGLVEACLAGAVAHYLTSAALLGGNDLAT